MYDCILKMNLGLYLVFVGNFEDAKLSFNEAIDISKKMNEFKNKFGDFSSLINVSVPEANNKYYDNSIELFAKHVRI